MMVVDEILGVLVFGSSVDGEVFLFFVFSTVFSTDLSWFGFFSLSF
jgi:hypothetical protein